MAAARRIGGHCSGGSVALVGLSPAGWPIVHYRFNRAWVVKITATDLHAKGGGDVAIEEIVISHEGVSLVPSARPPAAHGFQTVNNSLKFKQLRNTTGTDSVCSGFVLVSIPGGTTMLTRKQHELLMFIHERLKEAGIPPSFDEMKDALDLASKSGIHRLITALEERGFIRRLPNRARALEVLRLPDSIAPGLHRGAANSRRASSRAASAARQPEAPRAAPPSNDDDVARAVSIPVMGRIAAGVPIEAIQHKTHSITVPPEMISGGEHYALEVKGDSMIEAGIFDGDTVIIRNARHRQPGRDHRGAGRRRGSDAEAVPPQGRLDRAGGRQPGL